MASLSVWKIADLVDFQKIVLSASIFVKFEDMKLNFVMILEEL